MPSTWDPVAVKEHLKRFLERALSAGRDRFATENSRLHRQLGFGSGAQIAARERQATGQDAFPKYTAEVRRLMQARKLPSSAEGLAVARSVVEECTFASGSIAAAGALATIRDTFAEAALPVAHVSIPDTSAEDGALVGLLAEVPAAAGQWSSALQDLRAERTSYQGPANEIRQALWTVLQELAPTADVTAQAGYTLEPGTNGPTHRQRAEYILRSRRGDATPDTLRAMELVAELARDAYQRSNKGTHQPLDREAAVQQKRMVEFVLRELLYRP